ncbi:pilus assembly protein CpaE [Geodermatophilus sp. Leaf369]|uniref:AAA family ATPase n=1 Tax=Geodermatophilus sp. Leaf369 TaxID=1736354 RepID=UPI0006F91E3F|nr:AAA family ATPase [Geodermatophilus sp. Leaf369]KQS59826.1 pilus assembly protein CpaE [Geodermatophilus sp. Leaf369]
MTSVLLSGADDDLLARVTAAADGQCQVLDPVRLGHDPRHLFEGVPTDSLPEVVMLGPGVPVERALALAGRFDELYPALSVVIVATADPDLWVRAMRSGVRDVLAPDAAPDDVRVVLDRAARVAAGRRRALRPAGELGSFAGRVVTVASPKGGVGKTTVSTNLAVGLARIAPQSTVLVDLDVQFGDVASALALTPEYTLPDTVVGPAAADPMVLKTFLTQHPAGLFAVCGAESPIAGDSVTAEQVGRLLRTLAQEFRYVVVDTAPGLSEHTLAALEAATDVVVLSSMDVPGVRGLRKELDVLTELDLVPPSKHVVLNFADARGGLSRKDVETAIGCPIDVMIPRSKAVPLSTNVGVPLLQSGTKDPVTKELRALVARFGVAPVTAVGRRGARHRAAS